MLDRLYHDIRSYCMNKLRQQSIALTFCSTCKCHRSRTPQNLFYEFHQYQLKIYIQYGQFFKQQLIRELRMDPEPENQLRDLRFFIALDFQIVWINKQPRIPCPEIVEINATLFKYQEQKFKRIRAFHRLVRPKLNSVKVWGNFDLKNQEFIEEILPKFSVWLEEEKELNLGNSTFITWGSEQLEQALKKEIGIKKLRSPAWLGSFIDLKYLVERTVLQGKSANAPSDACKFLEIEAFLEEGEEKTSKGKNNLGNIHNILKYLTEDRNLKPTRKWVTNIIQLIPGVTITEELEYLLVIDFETTCEDNVKLEPCSEIIELPTMVVELKSGKIVEQFHEYVTPEFNPVLTKFCTELTGITQEMVTNRKNLCKTLEEFDKWLFRLPYLHSKNFTFMTCGDWDLASCLKKQCREKGLKQPQYMKDYINIKEPVAKVVPALKGKTGMMGMLQHLGIKHQGRHHSGIDDIRNICSIAIKLMEFQGFKYKRNLVKYVK